MMNITDIRKPSFEVSPQFIDRWSPRSFLEKEVPDEVLYSVFEASRWAPSASNLQPWRFIIARTEEDREAFYSFIVPGNLVWCKSAPVLAVVLSQTTTERGPNAWHAFDAGTAWGYLALEANRKGLITHAMGGFDKEKARDVLHLPDEYEAHAVIAIGYQGEPEALPENLREREQPSNRRLLKESLFEGVFGKNTLDDH
ncbi:nitroreductase family protein [Paenibacillus sp. GD4]|uniref:nitroreductase family protein n=1 Tax=Paenibacillus sp. GD4 TaxID=3068890 RepID=UPI00358F35F1